MPPELPECPYFGPGTNEGNDDPVLPADWTGNPFDYLPEVYVSSDEELRLADQYLNGDFSGGYVTSQIAYFRAPRKQEQHESRRERIATIQSLVGEANLTLPKSLIELATRDDVMDRIRHNTVWFRPQPRLVDFPAATECKILELFYEGQGCGYWSLLLCPDSSAPMICCDESINVESNYPSGYQPDIATFTFYQCACNFDEWLTIYFLDCQRDDQNYEAMLKKYPGM